MLLIIRHVTVERKAALSFQQVAHRDKGKKYFNPFIFLTSESVAICGVFSLQNRSYEAALQDILLGMKGLPAHSSVNL